MAESVIPAPFYLGVPAADIVQDQHMIHLPNINIFVHLSKTLTCSLRSSKGTSQMKLSDWSFRQFNIPMTRMLTKLFCLKKCLKQHFKSVLKEARDENDCDDSAENRDESDSDEDCGAVKADSVAFLSLRSSHGGYIFPPIRMDL